MRCRPRQDSTAVMVLDLVGTLMKGGRHSRSTVSTMYGVSLPTADRWLIAVAENIPGMKRFKVGRVVWLEWEDVQRKVY
jgi:hypothetical protein